MNQGTLFDIPAKRATGASRRSDPPTAKAAAQSVPVADLSDRIMRALRITKEGRTTIELAWLLQVGRDSVSPRMKALVTKGLVVDSGETRKSENGRAAIVWKAVS